MKTKTIVGAVAVSAVLSLYGANGLAGVKSVGDSVCTVSDSVAMSNGIAIVDYVLKPETESHIRCRIALPPPEKWNGEFWGIGNSSFGGVLPDTYGLSAAMNAAAATTDLGTSAYVSRVGRTKNVPPAVLRDYAWRATHLMTVYGKRIVKAFYGRDARHAYFRGGSCGGRQGLTEVMRFPTDYDGVLSSIPAGFPTVSSAQFVNLYSQTHD
ncbi:MAG: tannase/feruloyl esterase family alpha/beta hydrolase, partial [Kiritimatiellae bacterium]|nr:tannase/feruloyl esterase family alpha/beta hydrolase [Kiritimatiellia bacterium]